MATRGFKTTILEKEIEKYLIKKVEELGGLCWKFVSPGRIGVPDRIVMLPSGELWFVELKQKGEYPRAIQIICHAMLFKKGGRKVVLLDCYEQVDAFIKEISEV